MGSKVSAIALAALVALGLSFTASRPADAFPQKGTYKIDPRHTQVLFTIQHMGLSHFFGRFSNASGMLTFDPAALEASKLDAQIDVNSIDTHVAELDKELKEFFSTDKFPTASFTATQIVKTGPNTGTVTGNLTLAGVTKPITLNVTFDGGRTPPIPLQPYRLGFDATATIHRADFGLTHAMWSGMVSDDVTLQIECELEKQ